MNGLDKAIEETRKLREADEAYYKKHGRTPIEDMCNNADTPFTWFYDKLDKFKDDPEFIIESLKIEVGELKIKADKWDALVATAKCEGYCAAINLLEEAIEEAE